MKNIGITILVLLLAQMSFSQCDVPSIEEYQHHQIVSNYDTIFYHSYSTSKLDSVTRVVLYIQGSGGKPIFQLVRDSFGYNIFSSVPFDLNAFDRTTALILVSKKGIPFCVEGKEDYIAPRSYFENEKLDYRVFQNNLVINDLVEKIPNLKKCILLGHSEGSDVAAKLCTVNKSITHLGYWSGGGNSQFYDFPLFISKEMSSGAITQEEGLKQYESLIEQYKLMLSEKDSIDKQWYGNSFTRWAYFNDPPIESLVKIDIPIYLVMGVSDNAVPFESAMLIPVEFARLRKDNLTHRFLPHLDHGFYEHKENGEVIFHWDSIFQEFLNWVDNH